MIDVILLTETGDPIGPVSFYCTENKYNLIVVDSSRPEDKVVLQSMELSDGFIFTILKQPDPKTVGAAVRKALHHCIYQWVLLIDDSTFNTIRNLNTLKDIAETVPRLASIRQTNVPGIHPTQYNTLMGTLYSVPVLNGVHTFPSMVTDASVVAYDWAMAVGDRGFIHVSAYVEDTGDSPAIVLPREIEDHLLEEKTRDSLVIPQLESVNGWMGSVKKRPWHFKATVVIPHFGTDFRLLMNVIESWRLQTEHPYILIYDTGTPPEHHESLRALASYDTEVHFCRWHGVRKAYDPVALAYNHGITDCRTKYIIFTHNDLVPISRTLVNDLILIFSGFGEMSSVVGYESDDRPGFVGTHLTAAYMPALDRIRARWDIVPTDTRIEDGFNDCLKNAGIVPRFIGKEKKGRAKTPHFDHVGGLVTAKLYLRTAYRSTPIQSDLDSVIEETEARLQLWRGG